MKLAASVSLLQFQKKKMIHVVELQLSHHTIHTRYANHVLGFGYGGGYHMILYWLSQP